MTGIRMTIPKLSICIPTYNRLDDLRNCLALVLPQIEACPVGQVELIIVDNASTDGTADYLKSPEFSRPFLRRYTNPTNLGFDGNTIKCFQHARGQYIALLSDDDRYLPGTVQRILDVIAQGPYAFIFLNYYTFFADYRKPYKTLLPEVNRRFLPPDLILHQPEGGNYLHYSGCIYRSELAHQALDVALQKKPVSTGSRARCFFLEVAFRVTVGNELPSFLIGRRFLAAKIDNSMGETYRALPHLTLESCEIFKFFYDEGLLSRAELERRYGFALRHLPTLAIKDTYRMPPRQIRELMLALEPHLGLFPRYRYVGRPMMWFGCFGPVRMLYHLIHSTYRKYKKIRFFSSSYQRSCPVPLTEFHLVRRRHHDE